MNTIPNNPQNNGFVLNTRSISAIVGLITLFGTLYTVVNKVNSYEYRLAQVEINDTHRNKEIQILTSELKILNQKLTDLTIELREFRAEQKANQSNKR